MTISLYWFRLSWCLKRYESGNTSRFSLYPYLREGVCFTFWPGGGSLFEAMRFYSNYFLFFSIFARWCTFSMGKDESIWRKSTKRDTKKKFCFWRLRTLPWIRKKLYWQLITMDKIILICPEDIYMAWLSRFVLLDVEYMRVMTRFIQETRATKAQFSFPPWNTLYLKIIKCNTCVRKASRYIIDE